MTIVFTQEEQNANVNVVSAAPATVAPTQNTLQPGVHLRQHRRQSSINTVSWTDQGDNSSGRIRPLSNNLDRSDVRICVHLIIN